MTIRKNKFSYFAWILFLIAGFYTLFVSSFEIAQSLGKEDGLWSVIVFVVTIVTAILLLFVLRSLVKILENKLEPSGPMSLFAEGIGLFFLVVIAFVTRFLYITYFDDSAISDLSLINLAQNKDATEMLEISTGTFIYTKLLSVFTLLFGIKAEAGMYLNLFLQVLIVFLIYFSFRCFFNKFTAFLAISVYSFLPPFLHELTIISPEILLTLFHALGFFAVFAVISAFYKKKIAGNGLIMAYLFAGVCIGLTMALDISGLSLLFMTFVYLLMAKKNYDYKNKTGLGIILILLSAIVVWGLVLFGKSSVLSCSLVDLLKEEYITPFVALDFNLKMATPGYGSLYSLVFTIPVVFLVIRFFQMERDYYSLNYIFIFVLSLISLFQASFYEYSSLSNFAWLFIAVYGILSLVSQNGTEPVVQENKVESQEMQNLSVQKAESYSTKAPKTKTAPITEVKTSEKKEDAKRHVERAKITAPNRVNSENRAITNADAKQLESQLEFLQKKSNDTSQKTEKKVVSEPAKAQSATNVQGNQQVQVRQQVANNSNEQENQAEAKAHSVPLNTNVAQEAKAELENNTTSKPVEQMQEKHTTTHDVSANTTALANGISGITTGNTGETAGETADETLKENVAPTPPPTPSKPVMKYGRRMDYKTAVVSSPRGIPTTNSSTIKTPATIQNQSNEVMISVVNNEKSNNVPVQNIPTQAPSPQNINNAQTNVSAKPATVVTSDFAKQTTVDNTKTNENKTNATVAPVAKPPAKEIPNPLPTPKKHVAKDMDFDYQPPSADMHFDLVDLRGRDYFDIN